MSPSESNADPSLLEHYARREFLKGLDRYAEIPSPGAADDRLAGLCQWGLERFDLARQGLYRALQRGAEAALLDLAGLALATNDLGEAEAWLEPDGSEEDLALKPRLQWRRDELIARLQARRGETRRVIHALQRAIVTIPLTSGNDGEARDRLRFELSGWQHWMGRDERALAALEADSATAFAWRPLEPLIAAQREYLRLHLGLEPRDSGAAPGQGEPDLACLRALTGGLSANNDPARAATAWAEVARAAPGTRWSFVAIEAYRWHTVVALSRGDLAAAESALGGLERLQPEPVAEAWTTFGAALLAWQRGDSERGEAGLRAASQGFDRLDFHPARALCQLYTARFRLERGETSAAKAALVRLAELLVAFSNWSALLPDLRLMPGAVREGLVPLAETFLERLLRLDLSPPAPTPPVPPSPVSTWQLQTLGRWRLLADGREREVKLGKLQELMVYLCVTGGASLESILEDVFPESDSRAATNYFHQLRHRLGKEAPGLAIHKDETTSFYVFKATHGVIACDAVDLQAQLAQPLTGGDCLDLLSKYGGPFLHRHESAWVESKRREFEWQLMRAALDSTQSALNQGDLDGCERVCEALARTPLIEDGLIELRDRALQELRGLVKARQAL